MEMGQSLVNIGIILIEAYRTIFIEADGSGFLRVGVILIALIIISFRIAGSPGGVVF